MSDTVNVKGIDEVIASLDTVVSKDGSAQKVQKACAIVERAAKQKAPKGNGELRRSIASEVNENGADIVGVVFTPLEYAPYVEFGTGLFAEEGGRQEVPWSYKDDEGNWHSTSGMKPQPFLRPALYENIEKIKRILGGQEK